MVNLSHDLHNPVGIYLLKVNKRNTGTRCEICSKLTIKTPERHQWRRSGVFIVDFEHYFTPCSCVSIVNFEHVNADWESFGTKSRNGKFSICNNFNFPNIMKGQLKYG